MGKAWRWFGNRANLYNFEMPHEREVMNAVRYTEATLDVRSHYAKYAYNF